MALFKSVGQVRGEDVAYWKIVMTSANKLNDRTEAHLYGYVSAEQREMYLNEPLMARQVYLDGFFETLAEIYTELKSAEIVEGEGKYEFYGAEDC